MRVPRVDVLSARGHVLDAKGHFQGLTSISPRPALLSKFTCQAGDLFRGARHFLAFNSSSMAGTAERLGMAATAADAAVVVVVVVVVVAVVVE